MGGGNTKHYILHFESAAGSVPVQPPLPSNSMPQTQRTDSDDGLGEGGNTAIEQVKKPMLTKTNSHPDLLGSTVIFCPYIDLKMGKKGEASNVIQRKISREKSSLIGGGKLNYKKSDFFEFSKRLPWLLKNAHLVSVSIKEFQLGRVIGAGRSGKVCLAQSHKGRYCVIRTIKKDYILKNNATKHILSERETLYLTHHPFIMRLFCEFEDNMNVYLALEYVPGGELRSLLTTQPHQKFELDAAKFYFAELILAVEHMHSLNVLHRDLRPENICIDEDGHLKVVDFSHAMRGNYNINGKLYTICCPPAYLSPELLNSKYDGGYGKEVDIWALGIILYELLHGVTPFCRPGADSQYEILLAILQHKLNFSLAFDVAAKGLIQHLLMPEADRRMVNLSEAKDHAFFSTINSRWPDVAKRQLVPPFIPTLDREGDSRYFAATVGSAKHWKAAAGMENKLQLF